MTSYTVLSQMLASKHAPNVLLLKKIMHTVMLGRLRIQGEPPDKQVSLADYFLDDERILLDFTRLSDNSRPRLKKWLLDAHEDTRELDYFHPVSTTDYRGFTAEASLSVWGQIKRWFFGKPANYWSLASMAVNLEHQLLGIEIEEGKHGMLVGFNQQNCPESVNKYGPPSEIQNHPLGNTKRVYLTDAIVNQLIHTDLDAVDLEGHYAHPHPHSIVVENLENRYKEMSDYRKMHQFADKPWYLLVMVWVASWFSKPKPIDISSPLQLKPIMTDRGVHIYESQTTKEIIVREPRPDLDALVLCGGGIKLFTHVGVLQAFKEADIQFTRFAGSSAGGIINFLSYIGYTPEEILFFLNQIRPEHLVHYDLDTKGLSSTSGLKAALDYMVAKKVDELVATYKIPHPEGVMSFMAFETLKQQCPGCGIGNEFVVTATNKCQGKTTYLSLKHSPNMEVTKAVVASASFPVLYKPMDIEGEDHNDGGILNNFPTEAFRDDYSTLLEAENGSYLKLFAVQFDNGTERSAIDSIIERVHKESKFMNWLYQFLTGVNDPASGWEQDRIKLRQHALQSIVVPVGNIGSTQFDVSEKDKKELVRNGYNAASTYIKTRYREENNEMYNDEMMQTRFTCWGDFLSYCCYRNNAVWFKHASNYIEHSKLPQKEDLIAQAQLLQQLYFPKKMKKTHTLFNTDLDASLFSRSSSVNSTINKSHYDDFLVVYPLIFQLSQNYLQDKKACQLFEKVRHSLSLHAPIDIFIEEFSKIDGKMHVLFHIVKVLLQSYLHNASENKRVIFQELTDVLQKNRHLNQPHFYGSWRCSEKQCLELFALFKTNASCELRNWCENVHASSIVLPIPSEEERYGSSLEI